jgi:predicted DNA-binding transcriptional regulator AlpA
MDVSYTIPQFCDAYHFSRVHYYTLKKQGLGPDELRLGRKVVITRRAVEQWEQRMRTPPVNGGANA